jgi:hypothetical protein
MLKTLLKTKHIFDNDDAIKMPSAGVLLICHDDNRGFEFNGRKYSHLIDSINERLIAEGLSTITIATPFSHFYGESAFGNVWGINGVMARAYFVRKICRLFRRININQNDQVVDAWFNILKKTKPRIIIGIQPSRELCIAAKKIGIWVADVQHGILSNEGYYGLKNRMQYDDYGWPDVLLAWDEESANWINQESREVVKGIVVGNPWHLRFIYPKKCDSLVNQLKSSFQSVLIRKRILITLAWGMENCGAYSEIGIPQALIDVIHHNDLPYHWWIRIHPVQLNSSNSEQTANTLRRLFGNCLNVSWDDCTKQPLPLVLSHVSLHITMFSATTIEAEWYGVKTALLHEDENLLRTYLGAQISRGAAEVIPPERKAIIDWIESSLYSDSADQNPINSLPEEPFNNLILNIKKYVQCSRTNSRQAK